MENCNVCGCGIIGGNGVFISGLIKDTGIYGCGHCKADVDKVELIKNIRAIQEQYHYLNWFNIKSEIGTKEGHGFVLKDGQVVTIEHTQGNCCLDDLVEYIESSHFRNDVVIMKENQTATQRKLGADECGGCGQLGVKDNCCVECAKGYPEPTLQERKEALEYFQQYVEPKSKPIPAPFPLRREQMEVVASLVKRGYAYRTDDKTSQQAMVETLNHDTKKEM